MACLGLLLPLHPSWTLPSSVFLFMTRKFPSHPAFGVAPGASKETQPAHIVDPASWTCSTSSAQSLLFLLDQAVSEKDRGAFHPWLRCLIIYVPPEASTRGKVVSGLTKGWGLHLWTWVVFHPFPSPVPHLCVGCSCGHGDSWIVFALE